MVLVDSLGNLIEQKSFGGKGDDKILTACESSDGKVLLAGYTYSQSAGRNDILLYKIKINHK